MIPKKIGPFFKTTRKKNDGENTLVEGILTCCNSDDFKVLVAGDIKYNQVFGMRLLPKDGQIALEVCCKECDKVISVFYSDQDGYDHNGVKCSERAFIKPLFCKKCFNNTFSVKVKYEYPDRQEFIDLGITEMNNAFTWIWISLECKLCGKRYRNFVDFETG